MKYRILVDGSVWMTGLDSREIAERVVAENLALRPGLDMRIEAVAR